MGRVEGRTAIVTGGAKGMGAAMVSLLAAEGARVIAADVDLEGAEELAGQLGPDVVARRLDVRSVTDWAEVVRDAEKLFGTVDILINDAGIADPAALSEWDTARLQHTLDVNLIGAFNGLQAVTAGMRRAGGGSIVNIGSVGAFQGVPRMFGYVVSKWALRGLTKTAALELGHDGIRVNMVHPGQTRTPMTEGVVFDTHSIALGRVGEPEDIANAVLYFASDESRFVTGTEVLVDGGMLAGQADYQGLPQ
ncbi:SDR family NAD(P)-dependent oxidoreductase [Paractinoplanes brasiliensis]|uniref:3alpha(Or 20beta)-hydroxysteroid dehydrogenase n=1 Tax=Paractinoplanes brasiliensis TaxID=52695 RepID=A0A4R6JLX4_9ACTN|nr:glucose 1-dehydrogenase [Actinoplanes brasiliensis]TDO37139.1 3alpha(or 20beta)-hydroxysteroid dehydrogenase [Actinoplanes brasiliensis]GID33429.1 3-alpha-hydroxysteroid dehydrogenase [Actinoplanes brasiliensis]